MEFYGLSLYDISTLVILFVAISMILLMGISSIGIKIVTATARNLLITAILTGVIVIRYIIDFKTLPVSMTAMLIILVYLYWCRVTTDQSTTTYLKDIEYQREKFGAGKK